MKRTLVLALFLCSLATSASAVVTFDYRDKLNVVNARGVTITSSTDTATAPYLVDGLDDNAYWNGGTASGAWVQVDLGAVRNVKTIRLNTEKSSTTNYRLSSMNVETSMDGLAWTAASGTFSLATPNGNSAETGFVLDSAIDTRYVRMTRTDTDANQWRLSTIRMFGDTGTLSSDGRLDLITRNAFVTSKQLAFNRSGYTGEDVSGNPLEDCPTAITDQKYISFHGYDAAKDWDQTWMQYDLKSAIKVGKLGIVFDKGFMPATIHFQVHSSAAANNTGDNSKISVGNPPDFSSSTLLLDWTGTPTAGLNVFDFTTLAENRYYRIDFLSAKNASDAEVTFRMGTLMMFEQVAPPGDANGDNKVDFADYLILESSYGSAPGGPDSDADFDNNNVVEFADYLVLEANFGTGAVPEPMTLSLLALGGLALLRRR